MPHLVRKFWQTRFFEFWKGKQKKATINTTLDLNILVITKHVKTTTILAVGSVLILVVWQKDLIFQQPFFKAESQFEI